MTDIAQFAVAPGSSVRLSKIDAAAKPFGSKEDATRTLEEDVAKLIELQDVFYASGKFGLVIVFQGLDGAGKDGAIKHVMSGVAPQGVYVYSFKAPSSEEIRHDFLWRVNRALPERGRISIFNRSHYEEVLVVRVNPQLLKAQELPDSDRSEAFWQTRFDDINAFERHLARAGTLTIKFFLHVSKQEQCKRLLARVGTPDKNWKFSPTDLQTMMQYDDYAAVYEDALSHTSTEWAPWYIVPSDRKSTARATIGHVLVERLEALGLSYPRVTDEQRTALAAAKVQLEKMCG